MGVRFAGCDSSTWNVSPVPFLPGGLSFILHDTACNLPRSLLYFHPGRASSQFAVPVLSEVYTFAQLSVLLSGQDLLQSILESSTPAVVSGSKSVGTGGPLNECVNNT